MLHSSHTAFSIRLVTGFKNVHLIVFIVKRLIRSKPLPLFKLHHKRPLRPSGQLVYACPRVCGQHEERGWVAQVRLKTGASCPRYVLRDMRYKPKPTVSTDRSVTSNTVLNNAAHSDCQQL